MAEILVYLDSLADWQSQAEEAKAARAERRAAKSKPRSSAMC